MWISVMLFFGDYSFGDLHLNNLAVSDVLIQYLKYIRRTISYVFEKANAWNDRKNQIVATNIVDNIRWQKFRRSLFRWSSYRWSLFRWYSFRLSFFSITFVSARVPTMSLFDDFLFGDEPYNRIKCRLQPIDIWYCESVEQILRY